MSTALFQIPGVLAPLQGLWHRLLPSNTNKRSTQAGITTCVRVNTTYSIADSAIHASLKPQINPASAACRPLRVVRVQEAGQAPAQVGRMTISGRMADVCAELDRLAAREATLH